MTPFEQRLAETPHRELPAELSTRILATGPQRPTFPVFLLSIFQETFRLPHPLAGGAVAAGWLAIAILNLSGPRGPELYAVTSREYRDRLPSAQDYLVQMELRDELIARLTAETFEEQPIFYLRRDKL